MLVKRWGYKGETQLMKYLNYHRRWKMRLTNTVKHFGLMLLLGIAAWFFAYVGKAQWLGWFPNIAALIVTVYVEYRQWQHSGKPVLALLKERGLDSLVDILAGNAGFWLGYNLMLRLTAGGWVV
jgi:hypothetical protein